MQADAKAALVKDLLAPLANEAKLEGADVDFTDKNTCGAWPFFFAFASLIGQICVVSVEAGMVITLHTAESDVLSGDSEVILLHENSHFQRLA